jgi:CubicO group peptidase (beta-lactamase class C family)
VRVESSSVKRNSLCRIHKTAGQVNRGQRQHLDAMNRMYKILSTVKLDEKTKATFKEIEKDYNSLAIEQGEIMDKIIHIQRRERSDHHFIFEDADFSIATVRQGIVNLTDPIEKYLPASVKVPEFNGHKITFEDLATHTSGLPEMPSNIWLNKRVGTFNPHYNASLLYQGLSNTKLTREPGTKFQYSSFGIGLLGHILSLKAGVPYEELVKDRILNVLGMNDTKITVSQNEIKNRFAVGHMDGKEISAPTIPTIMAGAGAFRSTASDLLKYVSANLGFLHTKLDDVIQLQHLIRHPIIPSTNPMNYSEYLALDYRVLTNLGTETLSHTGAINGWNANVAFTPTKQIGVVAFCSCDSTDADMGSFNWVLLHLTGVKSLTANSEVGIHTTPGLS